MAVTLAAGDVVTAARFNALAPMYARQASDQAITTTPANWNVGALSFAANSTFVVELFLMVGNASTPGFNFRPTYAVTGGTTMANAMIVAPAGAETSAIAAANVALTYRTPGTNSYGVPSATTDQGALIRIVSIITSTTAGTWVPLFASSAGTMTLYTGSFLIGHQVS